MREPDRMLESQRLGMDRLKSDRFAHRRDRLWGRNRCKPVGLWILEINQVRREIRELFWRKRLVEIVGH